MLLREREGEREREILFNNYVDLLFKNEVLLRAQHRFREVIITKCTQNRLIRYH